MTKKKATKIREVVSTKKDTSVYREPGQGTNLGPTGTATFRGTMKDVSQQTEVVRGTDPCAAKPEGVWKTNITEPESSVAHDGTVGTPLTVKPTNKAKPTEKPEEE